MTRYTQMVCVFIATAVIAAGFFLAGMIPPALVCLVLCFIWLAAAWFNWTGIVNLAFISLFIIASVGIWLGLSSNMLVISVICAVLAWDLHYFSLRIRNADSEDGISRLEGNHLLRIGILGLFSLALCLAILTLRYQFTFEWVLIFSILVIGGIAALTGFLRKMD